MNLLFFWEKPHIGYKTFSPTDRGGVFTGYDHESRHTLGKTNTKYKKNDLTHHKKKIKKNKKICMWIKL